MHNFSEVGWSPVFVRGVQPFSSSQSIEKCHCQVVVLVANDLGFLGGSGILDLGSVRPKTLLRCLESDREKGVTRPHRAPVAQNGILPKGPAVLKILRVVNLLCVVFLVRRGDLLSRRTLCGHHFPGNYRHYSSQSRVDGVLNLGGVVKTLWRSNSLFLLSS